MNTDMSSSASSSYPSYFDSPLVSRSTTYSSRASSPAPAAGTSEPCHGQPMASTSQAEAQDPFSRPFHMSPVDPGSLQLDDSLASIPIDYTLDKLRQLGPRLLEATSRCAFDMPSSSAPSAMPSTLRLSLPPHIGQELKPTHVLACSGFDKPSITLLQPVFGLPYALSCSRLSALSQAQIHVEESGGFRVPVVYLSLSSIACFPLLHAWVTCPSVSNLVLNLLPHGTDAADVAQASTSRLGCVQLVAKLSYKCSAGHLMEKLNMLHGLREDVICLGMADQTLWHVLALVNSIICSTIKQQQMMRAAPAVQENLDFAVER